MGMHDKIKRWDGTDESAWEKVMKGIRMGMPEGIICESAGISMSALRNWLDEGATEFENGEDTIKARFYRDVCEARSFFVADSISKAPVAKNANWYEWMLSRRMPKEFGEKADGSSVDDGKVIMVIDTPSEKIPLPPSKPTDTPSGVVTGAEVKK